MSDKYEIGTQWKTRGGWRAVVVAHEAQSFGAWHDGKSIDGLHDVDGKCMNLGDGDFDLIEPWKEQREGEVWVHVQESDSGYIDWHCHTKEYPAYEVGRSDHTKTIAKILVKWKEGWGL